MRLLVHPPGGQGGVEVVAVRAVSKMTLVSLASMDSLRVSMERALPKEGNGVVWVMWSVVTMYLGLRP
jgi:hypothetical protein